MTATITKLRPRTWRDRHPAILAIEAALADDVFEGWNPLINPRDPLIAVDMESRTFRALVAPFNSCILNGRERPGVCRRPPRDGQGYAFAHTHGEVGYIGRNQDHANPQASYSAAAAHYANTGTLTFIGRYFEDPDDEGAIWVEGALAPHVTEGDVLSVPALSGDWRWIEEERRLRLIASQGVLVPGFRKAYADDRLRAREFDFAMVASATTDGHDQSLITGWAPTPLLPEEEKAFTLRQRLLRIIGEAAGTISVCWERIEDAGVFDAGSASNVLRDAVEHVLKLRMRSNITAAATKQARVPAGSSAGGQFGKGVNTAATPEAFGKQKPSVRNSPPAAWLSTPAEAKAAHALLNKKARENPQPSADKIEKNRQALEKAKHTGRAGGELRGNSTTRRERGEALFNEFGGKKKGYCPCVHCGIKVSPRGRGGHASMQQDKILVAREGGGYGTPKSFPNLAPSCSGCNKSRGDTPLKSRPAWEKKTRSGKKAIAAAVAAIIAAAASDEIISTGKIAVGSPLGWDEPDLYDVCETPVRGILGKRKVITEFGEYEQTLIGGEVVDPKTVKDIAPTPDSLTALLAGVGQPRVPAGSSKGGQFGKAAGGPGSRSLAPPIDPRTASRAAIVAHLRATGFTRSVSVSVPALRQMAAEHIAARAGATPTPGTPTGRLGPATPAFGPRSPRMPRTPAAPAAPAQPTMLSTLAAMPARERRTAINSLGDDNQVAMLRATGHPITDAEVAAWRASVTVRGGSYASGQLGNAANMAVALHTANNLEGMTKNKMLAFAQENGIYLQRRSAAVGEVRNEILRQAKTTIDAPAQQLRFAQATRDRAAADAISNAARAAAAATRTADVASAVWQGKNFKDMNEHEKTKFALDTWGGTAGGAQKLTVHGTVDSVVIDKYSGGLTFQAKIADASGQQIGTVTRTISSDGKTVDHSYLSLNRTVQGGGFATEFNKKAFAQYRAAGIERVTVHANIDVGGYTWARQGFKLDPTRGASNARVRRRLTDRASDLRDAGRITTEQHAKITQQIADGDMYGITSHRETFAVGQSYATSTVNRVQRLQKITNVVPIAKTNPTDKKSEVMLHFGDGSMKRVTQDDSPFKETLLGEDWMGVIVLGSPGGGLAAAASQPRVPAGSSKGGQFGKAGGGSGKAAYDINSDSRGDFHYGHEAQADRAANVARVEAANWEGKKFSEMSNPEMAKFALDTWTGTHAGITVERGSATIIADPDYGTVMFRANITKNGKVIGYTERSISLDGSRVEHTRVEIAAEHQGGGFATAWNAHAIANYRVAGVKHVDVYANIDVGGYAWARQGFRMTSASDNDGTRQHLLTHIDGLHNDNIIKHPARRQMEAQVAAGDMRGLTEHHSGDGTSLFKDALLASDWLGVLDL